MEAAKLEHYKGLLQKQLADLLGKAEGTVNGMTDLKDNFPDPMDRALLESSRSRELRIRDRERKLIAKIKVALEKIEGGTFGICEVCEELIGEERLKARPVTNLCIDCKTEQEASEKRRGE